jgi:beta-lactamase class A
MTTKGRTRRVALKDLGLVALILALLLVAAACERAPERAEDTAPTATETEPAAPARDTALAARLTDVAAGIEGDVGIGVLHIQQGVRASVNGKMAFPLASVYKVPIAYAALTSGHADPADTVTVLADDRAPGETPVTPGEAVPVARLVERSLAHSDNTASDVLLRLAGGPAAVTARMHDLGIRDIRIDRSMSAVFQAWRGEGAAAFVQDPRDTGTADAVAALLAAIHRGQTLDAEARRVILESLRGAVTGPNRIRAGVPDGTAVAHKTGTLGPLTHDVGILSLPHGLGDVALAILIRSDAPLAAREEIMAAVARTVWDWFASPPHSLPPGRSP